MASRSPYDRRRRGAALTLRPALQGNCRRCHAELTSAFSYCYVCSQGMAGVRWARLAVHMSTALLPAAIGLLVWRQI